MVRPTPSPRQTLVLALSVISVIGLTIACQRPPTIVTPQGKTAYTADQIAVRVNELQNAAIVAESSGGMATADTRIVVSFAVSANQILAKTPAGWQTTVSQSWVEAKRHLPAQKNPTVVAAMGAVDVVLAVYGGAQ